MNDQNPKLLKAGQLCGLSLLLLLALSACSGYGEVPDAYGNFEGTEITVSSEANGKLLALKAEEGDRLEANAYVGQVDTTQLYLQKKGLEASLNGLKVRLTDIDTEVAVLVEQKDNLEREFTRAENLLAAEAITQKQVDDLKGQLDVVGRQISATRSRLSTANRSVLAQVEPLQWQLRQIDDQLRKSRIVVPVSGTILVKFVEPGELVSVGRPLFRMADLNRIYLRAFMSETQLANVRIGQKVKVIIDQGPNQDSYQYEGVITWVSDVAEFTPKIIQTKEERVNLVYAFKVQVENDGAIKLGMPGEVWFSYTSNE